MTSNQISLSQATTAHRLGPVSPVITLRWLVFMHYQRVMDRQTDMTRRL